MIKTYSPELIVFGLLDFSVQTKYNDVIFQSFLEFVFSKVEFPVQILNRISALVVGPGLSRNPNILTQVKDLLGNLNCDKLPIIFDGVLYTSFAICL